MKAFRDTWKDGIHSYLTYLRDRLTVARELLSDSASIFIQIGDENAHRVRALMDEVFGPENFVSQIVFQKTSSSSSEILSGVFDCVIWYKRGVDVKYRPLYKSKIAGAEGATQYTFGQATTGERKPIVDFDNATQTNSHLRVFAHDNITSQRPVQGDDVRSFTHNGRTFDTRKGTFKTDLLGLNRLSRADRLIYIGNTLRYVRFLDDFSIYPYSNLWTDTTTSGFAEPKIYVVQTNASVVERCILGRVDGFFIGE